MTDPKARERLYELIGATLLQAMGLERFDHSGVDEATTIAVADAILSAFPQIAPTEDVMEGARAIALRKWCGRFISLAESKELEANIAAFATAHAARLTRERDEAREMHKLMCDLALHRANETEAAESALSAAQKRVGVLEGALREIADASLMPDEWDYYRVLDGYADYQYRDADGSIRTSGVDDSNSGDVHGHGWECGVWSMSKKARAALSGQSARGEDEIKSAQLSDEQRG